MDDLDLISKSNKELKKMWKNKEIVDKLKENQFIYRCLLYSIIASFILTLLLITTYQLVKMNEIDMTHVRYTKKMQQEKIW